MGQDSKKFDDNKGSGNSKIIEDFSAKKGKRGSFSDRRKSKGKLIIIIASIAAVLVLLTVAGVVLVNMDIWNKVEQPPDDNTSSGRVEKSENKIRKRNNKARRQSRSNARDCIVGL